MKVQEAICSSSLCTFLENRNYARDVWNGVILDFRLDFDSTKHGVA